MPAYLIGTQLQIQISATTVVQILEHTLDARVHVGIESRPDGGTTGPGPMMR